MRYITATFATVTGASIIGFIALAIALLCAIQGGNEPTEAALILANITGLIGFIFGGWFGFVMADYGRD